MALVSTFELLLKPQLPSSVSAAVPALAPLSRTILQGYFLSIANPNGRGITLNLVFTTRTPGLDPATVLAFLDTGGVNIVLSGTTTTSGPITSTTYTFTIDANDTGLLILQPNITDKKLFDAKDFELRGYSEIFVGALGALRSFDVLVTPEHRGTFFATKAGKISDLGEVAYALPLAGGGSLIRLDRDS
jgi:hypothetical protein